MIKESVNRMRIYVDADACPVISIVEQVAEKNNIAVTLLCDTNHVLDSDYSEVKVIGAGADAVDFALVNLCRKKDIVVTQDYGVAAMALGKGAYAIITDGDYYYENEDEERIYHHMNDGSSAGEEGWLGMEIIEQMVEELKLNGDAEMPDEVSKKDKLFRSLGLFVGYYTFEVDMMKHAANSKENGEKALNVISNLFSELTTGGKRQKSNFIDELKIGNA